MFLILSYCLRVGTVNGLFLSDLNLYVWISPLPQSCHMPLHPIILYLITLIIFREGYKPWISLLYNCFFPPVTSTLLDQNISLITRSSNKVDPMLLCSDKKGKRFWNKQYQTFPALNFLCKLLWFVGVVLKYLNFANFQIFVSYIYIAILYCSQFTYD